ncbi:MAG: class I SAM-dependent methyltransferase [Acidobacteriota bacterium]|nr:class I SAM-dependent methyltransferase [Acidobacteriota bacterium]MDE2964369.1 class I SAM-dependent methyltransferase [Acidobacteriota bacterium]
MSVPAKAPERFLGRVEYYRKYRPGYPEGLLEWLRELSALRPSYRVADIGSGTGLLAERFLRHGYPVAGVEPNPEMRQTAEARLERYSRFRSIEGRAEATTLDSRSMDLIVAGQSFHWFQIDRAREEFRRISDPSAFAVLVWNQRKTEKTGFLRDYEELLLRHGTDYARVRHQNIGEDQLQTFFGPQAFHRKILANSQVFDREGLIGRTLSCSFVPLPGHPGHLSLMRALDRIFEEWQVEGRVTFEYDTLVYAGRLHPPQP